MTLNNLTTINFRVCLAVGVEVGFSKGRELYDNEHIDREVFAKHEQSSLHRDSEHRLGMTDHTQQVALPIP